jgi:uroporphyrinogen-III synthase
MLANSKLFKVIITRPEKQALIWAKKLGLCDIDSKIIPLLEIKSFQDSAEMELVVRPIKNCMLNLDLYQKIIFVSQNAVEYGMEWIENYWPQIPVKIDFFAVGETTANLLREYGVSVQDLAETTQGNMTSESLLSATGLQEVDGDKILILRGIGGRGHLAEELRKRGAKVEYCEVYEREVPAQAKTQLLEWLRELQGSALMAFHSGETLHNFQQLMSEIADEIKLDLQNFYGNLSVVIPSARLEREALSSGFAHCILAANATDEAMTEAVKHYIRSKQRDGK